MPNDLTYYDLLAIVRKLIIIIGTLICGLLCFAYFYHYTPVVSVYAYNDDGIVTFVLPPEKINDLANRKIRIKDELVDFVILDITPTEKPTGRLNFYQAVTLQILVAEDNFVELIIEKETITLFERLQKYLKERLQ